MSIKKSQAILKCFIDLKNSVWFTLGSEDKTMVWHLELFSAWLPVKVFKTLNDRQSYILHKFHKIEKSPANVNYHMAIKIRKVKRSWNALYISSVAFSLRRAQKISEDETMFCDT